jgi:hypothetical protein
MSVLTTEARKPTAAALVKDQAAAIKNPTTVVLSPRNRPPTCNPGNILNPPCDSSFTIIIGFRSETALGLAISRVDSPFWTWLPHQMSELISTQCVRLTQNSSRANRNCLGMALGYVISTKYPSPNPGASRLQAPQGGLQPIRGKNRALVRQPPGRYPAMARVGKPTAGSVKLLLPPR